VKNRTTASALKKVVVLAEDGTVEKGYINPSNLGRADAIDLLTVDGEHLSTPIERVKSVYFVREFQENFALDRKTFLSRPKLDGLWVRLRFNDGDVVEGIVTNDLLDLLDTGVQLTPPDLNGNSLRLFIPRSALAEMKVLGVVGVARRAAPGAAASKKVAESQAKLFSE
jgi:hypothetical protein